MGAVSLERDFDRIEEARRWITDGLERAQDFGNAEICADANLFLARCSDASGDLQQSQSELRRARKYAHRSKNRRISSAIAKEWAELFDENDSSNN